MSIWISSNVETLTSVDAASLPLSFFIPIEGEVGQGHNVLLPWIVQFLENKLASSCGPLMGEALLPY